MSNTPNPPARRLSNRQQKAADAAAAAAAATTLQVAANNEEQLAPATLAMVDTALPLVERFTKALTDESIEITEAERKQLDILLKIIESSFTEAMAATLAAANGYTDQKDAATNRRIDVLEDKTSNTFAAFRSELDGVKAEMESDKKPSKWAFFVGIALGIALGLWTWLASGIPNAGLFAWIFGAGALGLVVVIGNTFRAKRIERNPGPVVMGAKVSKPANPELESSSAGSTT